MRPELIDRAEAGLLARQGAAPEFGEAAVRPSYDGLGLANAAVTPLSWLAPAALDDARADLLPPFTASLYEDDEVMQAWWDWEIAAPIDHVVVLLMDGLGHDQLRVLIDDGVTPNLGHAIGAPHAFYAPITTVFPSTTTTALASLATGVAPAAHAIVGTTLYLREIGSAVNMIAHRPAIAPTPASYTDRQLNPDLLVPGPNLYQRLEAAGVHAEIVNAGQYHWSSISRYTGSGSLALKEGFSGYLTPADGFAQCRERLLANGDRGKTYTYLYIPSVDSTAHAYGPLAPANRAEAAALDFSLRRELLDPLAGRPGVVLLLVADHGQVPARPETTLWLNDHTDLMATLAAPLTGDGRAGYLFIRPGALDAALAYIHAHLGDRFHALTREEAVEVGLFGTPGRPLTTAAADRVGDIILLPRTDWVVRQHVGTGERLPGFAGVHAGLSRAEMLIPFLAYRMG
jgi:hypothetical protein